MKSQNIVGEKCFSVELFIVEVLVLIWLYAAGPEQLCTARYCPLIPRQHSFSSVCWVSHIQKMTLLYPSPKFGVGTSLSDALAPFGGKLQLRVLLITRVKRSLFHVRWWPAASTFVSV
jgi:hypothetical protein